MRLGNRGTTVDMNSHYLRIGSNFLVKQKVNKKSRPQQLKLKKKRKKREGKLVNYLSV